MTDFRALCVELIESVEVLLALRPVEARPLQTTEDRLSRARAALADEPAVPQPPTEGEVEELVAWLRSNALTVKKASGNPANGARQRMNRAAELLQRLSPPQPVLVSERLQQMEDLAADAVAELRYIEQSHWRLYGVGWDRVYKKADRLKPAHALPLPGQEVEG